MKATAVRIGAASLVGGLATGIFGLLVASPLGSDERDVFLLRAVFVLLCTGLWPVVALITFFANVATLHFLYRHRSDTK
jgi:hypothetical protein